MRAILFKVWIVFALLWLGYFGYLGTTSYLVYKVEQRDAEEWANSAKVSHTELAKQIAVEAEYKARRRSEERMDELVSHIRSGVVIPVALLLLFPISSFVMAGLPKNKT